MILHTLFSTTKHLLKYAQCTTPHSLHLPHHLIPNPSPQNPNFIIFSNQIRRNLYYTAYPKFPIPVQVKTNKEIESARYVMMVKKLKSFLGIDLGYCKIGEKNRFFCPQCEGGDSMERSFSLYVTPDTNLAMWQCYREKCGWRGHVRAFEDGKAGFYKFDENIIPEESIGLEPLCSELIAFFAERMISGGTLRRNGVMQKAGSEQVAIAFTYRRNGVLVGCKYRDMQKRFWQEKQFDKILYGVDDIRDTGDIIIVEGEMGKLSMEEAGFLNCVSVPSGALLKVSKKMSSEEKDTEYQYFSNCKEYLDKASRIILATDADRPGQALAEQLALHLGKERCWCVKWPMKSENDVCNDANEDRFLCI